MQTAITTPPKQYHAIKGKYPDAILVFGEGDKYNVYTTGEVEGDADKVKVITGIEIKDNVLSFSRNALDNVLHKLVKAGYKVAICDELQSPSPLKK